MTIKNLDWVKIRTLYETGTGSRELGKLFDVDFSTIQSRAKRHGWQSNKFTQDIENKINAISILQKSEINIHTKAHKGQERVLNSIIEQRLAMMGLLDDVAKIALRAQRDITAATIKKMAEGEYEPHQGAAIFKAQGLDVPSIAKITGIEATRDAEDAKRAEQNKDDDDIVTFYLPKRKDQL